MNRRYKVYVHIGLTSYAKYFEMLIIRWLRLEIDTLLIFCADHTSRYIWLWNIFICPDDHFVLAIVSDFYRHMLAYLARFFFKVNINLSFLSFSKTSIFHAKTEILHHRPLLREKSLHTFVIKPVNYFSELIGCVSQVIEA